VNSGRLSSQLPPDIVGLIKGKIYDNHHITALGSETLPIVEADFAAQIRLPGRWREVRKN